MAEISAPDIARAAAAVVKTFPEGRYFMDGTEVSYLRDGHVHIEYETDGSGIKVYVLFGEDSELVFPMAGGEQLALRRGAMGGPSCRGRDVCRVLFHGMATTTGPSTLRPAGSGE